MEAFSPESLSPNEYSAVKKIPPARFPEIKDLSSAEYLGNRRLNRKFLGLYVDQDEYTPQALENMTLKSKEIIHKKRFFAALLQMNDADLESLRSADLTETLLCYFEVKDSIDNLISMVYHVRAE